MSDTALPADWTTAQPYEHWKTVRESACPVVATPGGNLDPRTGYQVTDWQSVESVLRDVETFSSSINAEHIGQYMGDLILALDGVEHRKYRRSSSTGTTPSCARPSTGSSTRSRRRAAAISWPT